VIPARMVKEMILGFVFMIVFTVIFYFGMSGVLGQLTAMAYGMFFGAAVGLLVLILSSQAKLKFTFFGIKHFLLLFLCILFSFVGAYADLIVKSGFFAAFLLLYTYTVVSVGFITASDLHTILAKLKLR